MKPEIPEFPPEAWRQVTVTAPAALELFGEQNRGHLTVTVTNHSKQMLRPGTGGEIAFSFQVLDERGEVLPVEGVRTRLNSRVAPGESHSQKVTVIIPAPMRELAASIRVGLLQEGHYWVESLNREHPAQVRISPNRALDPAETRLAVASQIWPQGKSNGMRWPYGTMMVAESAKVFYIPVAKCACTSLKSMMLKLAGVERPDIAQELDVHFVTDRFNTGVQLKDRQIDAAREILASDQYFKFSVIRDPFERLVSAYLEKFVYNRLLPRNRMHIRPVMSAVQGTADIDLERGISFDQFVEHIVGQDPFDLDPHWRPQHLYFLGVPHMSRIFRLENIAELEHYLLEHHGVAVQLAHKNKTRKSDVPLPDAATLVAAEFDQRDPISPESFLSSVNSPAIRAFYHKDFELYNSAG